ncbi:MAG: molybdenum cofactor guanylyltransferase [Terriglobales bacterium]
MYDQRVNDLTAFVLAGGKSTRMGRDKAFLKLGNEMLVDRALSVARSVTENVWIVGDPAKFGAYGSVLEDIYPGRGPLGGIHAALIHSQAEFNLMIAVDTPFLETRFLEFLVEEAHRSSAMATVPRTGGHYHSVCAVYRREFAAVCEEALIREQNRIDALFANVRVISEEEIARLGFNPDMFRNLNTPEEWEQANESLQEIRK